MERRGGGGLLKHNPVGVESFPLSSQLLSNTPRSPREEVERREGREVEEVDEEKKEGCLFLRQDIPQDSPEVHPTSHFPQNENQSQNVCVCRLILICLPNLCSLQDVSSKSIHSHRHSDC